jgi:hypothetical protein
LIKNEAIFLQKKKKKKRKKKIVNKSGRLRVGAQNRLGDQLRADGWV